MHLAFGYNTERIDFLLVSTTENLSNPFSTACDSQLRANGNCGSLCNCCYIYYEVTTTVYIWIYPNSNTVHIFFFTSSRQAFYFSQSLFFISLQYSFYPHENLASRGKRYVYYHLTAVCRHTGCLTITGQSLLKRKRARGGADKPRVQSCLFFLEEGSRSGNGGDIVL